MRTYYGDFNTPFHTHAQAQTRNAKHQDHEDIRNDANWQKANAHVRDSQTDDLQNTHAQ